MSSLSRQTRAAVAMALGLTVVRPILSADNPDADAPAPVSSPASPSDSAPIENIVVTAQRLNEARATIQTQTGASTYTIDSAAILALPGGDNTLLNQVILQAPDVAQDSFGQLHIRGEHNGLQYRLNGIILPEGISVFSQTLDPRLVDSLQLIMGALPAEYGLRTAGIIDITTKTGALDPYGELSYYGGSHGEVQPSFFAGGTAGNLTYFATGDFLTDGLGLESPDGSSNPLHDRTRQYHGFAYFDYILDPGDRLSLVLGTSHADFQIPDQTGQSTLGYTVDGQSSYPSSQLNENQTEITHYGVVSYQHSQEGFDLQTSLTSRYTTLTFMPDPLGDLLYDGIAQDAFKRDLAFSWQTDAAFHVSSTHTVRVGYYVQHDRAESETTSQVLQVDDQGNQLTRNGVPLPPVSIIDNGAQTQNIESIYVQDEWRVIQSLTLNYGLRFDHLSAYTSGKELGPRLNVVWKPLPGTTVHGGYSRYFSPPPFELIGLKTITRFDGTSAAAPIDLADPPLPEKANYYDVGVQQVVIPGLTLGIDTYYKQSTDLIDEGQFGAPIILTPFNYRYGEQYGGELTVTWSVQNLSIYGNFAAQRARGKDVVSAQFNFDPDDLAYIANHYISLDHEQQHTASAGISYLWGRTRFGMDALVGSGLRADLTLPDGSSIPNGAHLPFYHQVNLGISHTLPAWWNAPTGPTLRFDVINLFDSVYQIRNGTGVGVGAPQYGPRRGLFGGISIPL